MQLAEPTAGGSVAAAGGPAATVRPLPSPARVSARGELVEIRTALLRPPQMMPLTHPVAASGAPAASHPPGPAAEHRIGGGEDEDVATELRPDRGHQPFQRHRAARLGPAGRLRGHSRTSPSANQPARSST